MPGGGGVPDPSAFAYAVLVLSLYFAVMLTNRFQSVVLNMKHIPIYKCSVFYTFNVVVHSLNLHCATFIFERYTFKYPMPRYGLCKINYVTALVAQMQQKQVFSR